MNKRASSSLLDRIFSRTGGWYPVVGLVVAQLLTGPFGIMLTVLPVRTNTDLKGNQVTGIVILAGILMLVRNILLLLGMYLSSRDMFTLLTKKADAQPAEAESSQVERAWRQVTSFSWRYIALAYPALIIFVLFPVLGYMSIVLHSSMEQMIYVFLAALASASGLAILEIIIVDFWLGTIRPLLLPVQFESQLAGVKGLRFRPKFEVSIIALILVSILLLAPVGYRQSSLMLFSESRSPELLSNVMLQLVISSIGGLLFGIVFALAIARSLSEPVLHMINIFREVEKGDLNQRVKTISTDETGELAIYFNHMIERLQGSQTNFEKILKEQMDALANETARSQITSQLARVSAEQREINLFLSDAAKWLAERRGYYHVGIFLADEGNQSLSLKAAAAEGGGPTLGHGSSVTINRESIVGNAAYLGKVYISNDVSQEALYTERPELPLTRAEAALPIRVQGKTIGILDIHSTNLRAFPDDEIEALETTANQIALAIQNQQLETEKRSILRQLDSLSAENVRRSWEGRLRQQEKRYRYTPGGLSSAEGGSSTGTSTAQDDTNRMNIPITLRGQRIGAIGLHRKSGAGWTTTDQALAQEIANQVALALENARLLDETRQRAIQEQTINELTGRFSRSLDPDVLLQSAVRELQKLPSVTEVSVYLSPPEAKKPEEPSE